MKHYYIVVALTALSANSNASVLDDVKHAVDSRATYTYYQTQDAINSERHFLKEGDKGNCFDFAYTYQTELLSRNIPSMIVGCYTPQGEPHALLKTFDGYILDIREKEVIKSDETSCLF